MKEPTKKYRVQMSSGGGSMSFEYFETLKQADLFQVPDRLKFDMMGFPRKVRLTVQQWINGKWKPPETNEIRLQIKGGKPILKIDVLKRFGI